MPSLVRSLVARRYPQQLVEVGGKLDLFQVLQSGFSDTGQYVDRDSSLRVSAVYACVKLISGTIGTFPIHAYRRKPDGSRERIRTPQTAIIWGRPNREVAKSIFWETVIGHCVLSGNAYIYVSKANGRPDELYPVDPTRVQVGRASDGTKVYLIDGVKEQRDYVQGGNMVHVQAWGTDGLKGLSPIALARQAIGLALTAEKSAAKLHGSGSQPGGILSTEQALDQAQADLLAAKWNQEHAGADNSGKIVVLGKGLKWTPTIINPDDMQFMETRRYQVVDIARDFLVPSELVNAAIEGSSSLTYTNSEDRFQHFLQITLQQWLVRFEQTISDELMAPDEYMKFDTRGLLRGNSTQRIAYYQGLANMGAITEDEIRESEDMEPIPAGAKRPPMQGAPADAGIGG